MSAACSSPTSPTAALDAPVSGFSQTSLALEQPATSYQLPAPAAELPDPVQSITVTDITMPASFEPARALPQPVGLGDCPVRQSTVSAASVARALGIIERMALDATRRPVTRRSVVFFLIEDAGALEGTHIAGELYRTGARPARHGAAMMIKMTLVPGALRFATRTAFLEALRTALPFDVEVRLTGRDLVPTCRPGGALTGRIEGDF